MDPKISYMFVCKADACWLKYSTSLNGMFSWFEYKENI